MTQCRSAPTHYVYGLAECPGVETMVNGLLRFLGHKDNEVLTVDVRDGARHKLTSLSCDGDLEAWCGALSGMTPPLNGEPGAVITVNIEKTVTVSQEAFSHLRAFRRLMRLSPYQMSQSRGRCLCSTTCWARALPSFATATSVPTAPSPPRLLPRNSHPWVARTEWQRTPGGVWTPAYMLPGPRAEEIHTCYFLVACDGAKSAVRHLTYSSSPSSCLNYMADLATSAVDRACTL